MTKSSTLDAVFRDATSQFESVSIDNPPMDARILITHALGIDRAQMVADGARVLTDEESGRIKSLLGRRSRREPIARIIGTREFWSLDFGLSPATLEPRPDSETLVEVALKNLKDRDDVSILDLGTGTGCLLLALLHELPNAVGLGIDYVMEAVDQARDNAERLNLAARATFRMSNWFDNIEGMRFDLIVSNPPYIKSNIIPTLMPEVRNHDPLAALDGGEDGLKSYRRLIPQLSKSLNPGGFAVFEVGEGQAATVAELFRQNDFTDVATHLDHGGIERCVKAQM